MRVEKEVPREMARRGQYLDVVMVMGMLAEMGRGSAQATWVGSCPHLSWTEFMAVPWPWGQANACVPGMYLVEAS